MRVLKLAAAFALAFLPQTCYWASGQEPMSHPTQTERPAVPMPPVVVLIVCKTQIAGPPDQNSRYTRHDNREWATEHAMMVCRREEVQMYDRAVDGGADEQPFTAQRCQRSAMLLGPQWDDQHKASSYRFWRVACPVPIVRKNGDGTEDIIAWKLPDCGHRDTVVCLVDTAI